MKVIGLVGGVASGKSFVAKELESLGACRLDADRAGHEVLQQPQVRAAAVDRWGTAILGSDGEIDRRRLAAIVFAATPEGAQEREYLERLTHPEIGRLLREEAGRRAAEGCRVAVLDAALLFEAGWDKLCDAVIFVDAPRSVRLARAAGRGWSEAQFNAREAAQASLDAKRSGADAIIDNSGGPEQVRGQLGPLWQALVGSIG